MKKKKIIKSLKRIQKFCEGKTCDICLINDGDVCPLRIRTPNRWDINHISRKFEDFEKDKGEW